jgi:hypothetical protein
MSLIGFMANTFLPFWQTSGLLLLLVVLFTFLLYRSPGSLFLELQTENMMGDVELTRLTLPVRLKDVTEHIDSITVKADQQNKEKLSLIEFEEEKTTEYHTSVKSDKSKVTNSQPVSIDQDLHYLMNRYIGDDEVEESKPIHSFYNEGEEETSFVRDLEALLEGSEQPHPINDTNRSRNSEHKASQSFDENVIEELLLLTPVKKKEDLLEEESFSLFEVIEEIKNFSPTKQDDQKDIENK